MIENCPKCHQQISSKATVCPHCEFKRDEQTEEGMAETRRRQLRDRIYRLKMCSYTAIAVLLAGFVWYWFAAADFMEPIPRGPLLVMGLGMLAYVIVRGLLLRARGALKKLRRQTAIY